MEVFRNEEIVLDLQNYIDEAPVAKNQQFAAACSNDQLTIESWKDTWIAHYEENHAIAGSFDKNHVGMFYGKYAGQAGIIVGAGPSLKHNVGELAKSKAPIIAALHSFHFLEDNGVNVDFYVTLDSGSITIPEVSEGGKRTPEEYWALTKNKKLLAFVASPPSLIKKWQGEIYWYNAPIPHPEILATHDAIEPFHVFISNGGHVLGACLYFAKCFLGCNPIVFTGADYAFSYQRRFHAWPSSYDGNLGNVLRWADIFGNKVLTWQSYVNFKMWMEWLVRSHPGQYINCTEGGILGAYHEGNIRQITQMKLSRFNEGLRVHELNRPQCENPHIGERRIVF